MNGHVALLLPDLRAGGAQRVFLTLASDFIDRGLRVDLVLAVTDGELMVEVPSGVRLVPLGRRMPAAGRAGLAVRTLAKLVRYLRAENPDAILSSLTSTNLTAVAAHCLAQVPTRLVLREAATLENLRHPLYKEAMRYVYRRAHRIIALTNPMREELIKTLQLDPLKVARIPNPVDAERISCKSRDPLPSDFDSTLPFALTVGRLVPQKDYWALIKAFKEVTKGRAIRLVILGEGPDRSLIESQVGDLELGDRIELRGYDPNPYRWMSRAACLVLSSRWEGYPNVVLEARVLGLPIVMTEYDASAREVGGDCALFAPVGDYEGLAHAIKKMLEASQRSSPEKPSRQHITDSYLEALGFQSNDE